MPFIYSVKTNFENLEALLENFIENLEKCLFLINSLIKILYPYFQNVFKTTLYDNRSLINSTTNRNDLPTNKIFLM